MPELAEALIQVMNVCGITTWGQTGYKVLDECKRLTQAKTAKKTVKKSKKAGTKKVSAK